jgi:hypothetical protein
VQKKQLDAMEVSFTNSRRSNLISDFSFDPTELRGEVYQMYLDRIEQPHDGTNQGLLEHPIVCQWAAADTGIPILTAHPGSGKTVIAKHMMEEHTCVLVLLQRQ